MESCRMNTIMASVSHLHHFCSIRMSAWSVVMTIAVLSLTLLPGLTTASPVATVGRPCEGPDCPPRPERPEPSEVFPINNEDMRDLDILLTPEDYLDMARAKSSDEKHIRRKRKIENFKDRPSRKWDLPIMYKFQAFDKNDRETENYKNMVNAAFRHWEERTCIKFVEVETHREITTQHILVTHTNTFCASYVGKIPLLNEVAQQISLPDMCLKKFGTPVHEVGHALGMWHEHQRPDRDQHIAVLNKNIGFWATRNFDTPPDYLVNDYDIPYDYNSVMHYGATVGSVNGQETIQTKDPRYQNNIGQRVGLSFLDVKAINMAYCTDKCTNRLPGRCLNGGYQDPLRCDYCRCPEGMSGRYCEQRAPSKSNCGSDIYLYPGDSRNLKSPGYDQGRPYNENDECNWLIKAPQGYRVQIEFQDSFGVYCLGESCFHWVEVNTNRDFSLPGPRFCCNNRPSSVLVSEGDQMLVTFRSNWRGASERNRTGFNAMVSLVTSDGGRVPISTTRGPRVTTTRPTTTTTRTTTRRWSTTSRTTTRPTTRPTTTKWWNPTTRSTRNNDQISWSAWSKCAGNDCPCGGCSRQSRVRMCGSEKCTGSLAAEEFRLCARACTETDKRQYFMGTIYELPCPMCCGGFEPQGNNCVRS